MVNITPGDEVFRISYRLCEYWGDLVQLISTVQEAVKKLAQPIFDVVSPGAGSIDSKNHATDQAPNTAGGMA